MQAMKRLRETGWKVDVNARDADSRSKRSWVMEVVKAQYPNSGPASHTVYVSNFFNYLRMEEDAFLVLDRISITHVRDK